jgi:putative nucleotidyltransferase with HDIG domain
LDIIVGKSKYHNYNQKNFSIALFLKSVDEMMIKTSGDGHLHVPEKNERINRKMSLKEKIIKKIDELPPLPQVVFKIHELIRNPDSNTKDIAKVIETDQAIATKVLRIANSAYYGMAGKISSIQHASVVLGLKTLGEIVTIVGSRGTLTRKLPGYGYNTKDLWEHSLAVAIGSKIIAGVKNPSLVNEAYTAGLIHDVGKIVLDPYILEQKDKIESYMENEEKTFLDAENHFFAFNHAEIAFEICEKWNFPEHINIAIKGHHNPSHMENNDLSYILHVADHTARLIGIGYDEDDFLYKLEGGTMDHIGLKQEDISEIIFKITDSMKSFSS